jgi:enamine deaminase RidA (YjgF/YER057c/UK114 family)
MAQRQNISSGTRWESIVGYSRVVRIGNHVWVAGTTATDDDGNLVGKDDVYAQSRYILEKIQRYLRVAGAEMHHVVRTRMYVVDAEQWQEATRAHGEFFGEIRPVSALVEVSALIGKEFLVEIEVDAFIHDNGAV